MTMQENTRFDAFLSYRHTTLDAAVTNALHGLLEKFRMPKGLGAEKRAGFRVFMDDVELTVSPELAAMIKAAATNAGCLFVICSRATQQKPRWIDQEISDFLSARESGWARVFPVLAEGTPEDAFPPVLLKRHRQAPLDFLDITAPTQEAVLENLRESRLWAQSRMVGVAEETLDRSLRRSRARRWIAGIAIGAVLLTGVTLGAGYFMRQAQAGRETAAALLSQAEESRANAQRDLAAAREDEARAKDSEQKALSAQQAARESEARALEDEARAKQSTQLANDNEKKAKDAADAANDSREKAEKSRAEAEESRVEAEGHKADADTSKKAADAQRKKAEQSRTASEASEEAARRSEEEARQYREDFIKEEENVQKAEEDYTENEIWSRIVLYELELENLRPLQARSYASALLSETGLTPDQQKAAQAIVKETHSDARITPVYREEGGYYAGYSPDGRTLVIGGGDGTVSSYDKESLLLLGQTKGEGQTSPNVPFTSDSEYLAIATYTELDGVEIYETRTLERVQGSGQGPRNAQRGTWDENTVMSAFFAPGTHDLYFSFGYRGMRRLSPDGIEAFDYPEMGEFNTVITINAETFIVGRTRHNDTAPFDPEVCFYLFNTRTGKMEELAFLGNMFKSDTVIQESTDGKYLSVTVGHFAEDSYVFDRETGKIIWRHTTAEYNGSLLSFSGDAKKMMHREAWTRYAAATIYELGAKLKKTGQYDAFDGGNIKAAQLCLDWNKILFAYDTTLALGDIETNQILEKVETPHLTSIQRLYVSPDGSQAVTVSDTEAIVWELK